MGAKKRKGKALNAGLGWKYGMPSHCRGTVTRVRVNGEEEEKE